MSFDAIKTRFANLKAQTVAAYDKAKAAATTDDAKDFARFSGVVATGSLVAEVVTSVFEEL